MVINSITLDEAIKKIEELEHDLFKYRERSFVDGCEIEKLEAQLAAAEEEITSLCNRIRSTVLGHSLTSKK